MTGARTLLRAGAHSPRHERIEPDPGVPGAVYAAWGALFFNVLAFSHLETIIPIPSTLGQLMTQGSLLLAVLLALAANPRVVLRSNLFLVLLTMLAIVAAMTSIHNQFVVGSTFRATRMLGFVTVLWLLTPWFGRRDLVLLRCHLRCLWIVLGSVMLGFAIAPGKARSFEGRLSGTLWPMPAHAGGALRRPSCSARPSSCGPAGWSAGATPSSRRSPPPPSWSAPTPVRRSSPCWSA